MWKLTLLYKNEYLWQFILHKGAAFQRKFKIYFSNSIHISKGIIAIESLQEFGLYKQLKV